MLVAVEIAVAERLVEEDARGLGEDLIGWQCMGTADRCSQAAPGWILRAMTVSSFTVAPIEGMGTSMRKVSIKKGFEWGSVGGRAAWSR